MTRLISVIIGMISLYLFFAFLIYLEDPTNFYSYIMEGLTLLGYALGFMFILFFFISVLPSIIDGIIDKIKEYKED